jgi:dynein heavy chain
MSVSLAEKKIVVDAKTITVEALIENISQKSTVAQEKQENANKKKAELEEQNSIIVVEKAKADAALLEAVPALEAAAEALNGLDKKDIGEIKSFTTPPTAVQQVCMCVLHLKPTGKENESDGWKGAKAMMGDPQFLNKLINYNKDGIKDRWIKKVKTYFRDPNFNMAKMQNVSTAAAGLFTWVLAIVKYYDVAREVEPLKLRVKTMQKQQDAGNLELSEIEETLSILNADLAKLSAEFTAANDELQSTFA